MTARRIASPAERLGWLAAVQRDDAATAISKAVAAVLVAMAVDGSGRAWPSVATMAVRSGFGATSVRQGIKALAKAGWLSIISRRVPGGCAHDRNLYLFTVPASAPEVGTSPAAADNSGAEVGVPRQARAGTSPDDAKRVVSIESIKRVSAPDVALAPEEAAAVAWMRTLGAPMRLGLFEGAAAADPSLVDSATVEWQVKAWCAAGCPEVAA